MRYFYEGIKIFVFIYRIKYKVDNGLKKIKNISQEYKGYNTINLLHRPKRKMRQNYYKKYNNSVIHLFYRCK